MVFPRLPRVQKTWQLDVNNRAASNQGGSTDNENTLFTIKDRMVSFDSNPWIARRSSNSAVVTGSPILNNIPDESINSNDGVPVGLTNDDIQPSIPRNAFTRSSFFFDGSADYIDVGNVSELNPERTDPFSIGGWFKANAVSATGYILSKYVSSGVGWGLYIGSDGLIRFFLGDSPDFDQIRVDTAYDDNAWHFVVAVNDGTGINGMRIYIDGALEETTIINSDLASSILNSNNVNIGRFNSGSVWDGFLTDLFFYDTNLGASDVSEMYNAGVPLDLRDLSTSANLVSFWRCGTGDNHGRFVAPTKQYETADRVLRTTSNTTNVPDFSSFANPGTFVNMDASNVIEDTPGGISNFACSFNGVDEYVRITHLSDLAKQNGNAFSISFWIKTTTTTTSHLVGKYFPNSGRQGYGVDIDGSGNPRFVININTTTARLIVRCDTAVNDGDWHHVMVTEGRPGTNNHQVTFYLDGVEASSTLVQNSIGNSNTSNSANFTIGAVDTGLDPFDGYLDEVALYHTTLREDQVVAIYNNGSPPNLLDLDSVDYLNGWWRMGDEIGNYGQNFSFLNTTKRGDVPGISQFTEQSIFFDGSNDELTIGNVLDKDRLDAFSISAWISWPSAGGTFSILSKFNSTGGPGFNFFVGADGLNFRFVGSAGQITVETIEGQGETGLGIPSRGVWTHCVVTYDGSSDASGVTFYADGYALTNANIINTLSAGGSNAANLVIGNNDFGSNDFIGWIDEVSMWNRELTSDEVVEIYNNGNPNDLNSLSFDGYLEGWWRMEGDIAGPDLWVDSTDLVWNTVNRSWIVLEKPTTGAQLLIDLDSSSSTDLAAYWSASGGFVGGTTASRPTAQDEVTIQGVGDWNNNYTTYSSWVHVWHTTDGALTRVVVATEQAEPTAFWIFDEVESELPGNWSDPEIVCFFEGPLAMNRDEISEAPVLSTGAKGYDSAVGGFDITLGAMGNDSQPSGFTGSSWTTEQFYGETENELQTNGGYPLAPIVVTSETSGARGVHGILTDMWWSNDVLASGTTYPESTTNKELAKFGQLVMPWTESNDTPIVNPSLTNIPDVSGSGNDGTLVNTEFSDIEEDTAGGTFSEFSVLFGGSEYMTVGSPAALDFDQNDAFSISFWMKTNTSGTRALIDKVDNTSPFPGYGVTLVSGTIIFNILESNGISELRIDTTTTWNDNAWHHVVATYAGDSDANNMHIYIDNVDQAVNIIDNSLTGSFSNTSAFQVAARDGTALSYVGNIDDVAVYNAELGPSEVSDIYNGGAPNDLRIDGPDGYDAFLVGYWLMGDGAIDSSLENTQVDGVYIGYGSVLPASQEVINYVMVGIDSAAPPGQFPAYHYWVVQDTPDVTGSQAGDLPFGGPLVNIQVSAQFITVEVR